MRRVVLFYTFQISNAYLNRTQMAAHVCSAFNSLTQIYHWKRKEYFSSLYAYLSLIRHWNSTSGSFLEVCWGLKPYNPIPATLKSTDLACTLKGTFTNAWFQDRPNFKHSSLLFHKTYHLWLFLFGIYSSDNFINILYEGCA